MACIKFSGAVTLAALLMLSLSGAARAEDQPFLTLDSTDIEPQFGRELEQNFVWASGLPGSSFNALAGETELEYGLADDVRLAGSVEYDWTRTRDHTLPGSRAISGAAFDVVHGEAIVQAMNVYFDPLGLAFLVGADGGRNVRSFEAKVLLQKNFLDQRLRAVVNLGGEFGTERSGSWSDVSALNLDVGFAYNITWEWSAAIEFNASHNFDGFLLDGNAVPTTTSYFIGPTLQYAPHPWAVSFGAQAQLPWASDATHTAGALDHGFSADTERFRIALRITKDF